MNSYGTDYEYEQEFEGEFLDDAEAEGEAFVDELLAGVVEQGGELGDEEVAEFAAELLDITNEAELDEFLGRVISRAARGVGRFARSDAGRALGGALKGVARKALPVVGGAIGSFVAPGVGTAIGSKLGAAASRLFELELEMMDDQEAAYEVAQRYVRLASSAARQAARAPRGTPPQVAARRAVISAARLHAPGIARAAGALPMSGSTQNGGGGQGGGSRRRSGTWSRRGNVVLVHGV